MCALSVTRSVRAAQARDAASTLEANGALASAATMAPHPINVVVVRICLAADSGHVFANRRHVFCCPENRNGLHEPAHYSRHQLAFAAWRLRFRIETKCRRA